MFIHGLQKMTLLDFPGKVACTVFLGGCDFRCPYCHNAELIDGTAQPIMEDTEFFRFLSKRKGLLDGVAITGGEPLLHRDLPEFLTRIRALGFPVKLDTNGNHPELLRTILDNGLADYIAMDIKNAPDRYAETIGLPSFSMDRVRESVSLLMEKAPDYEFRTTVVDELHDADSFREIGVWIRGARRYFLQPFTDRDSVCFAGLHAPSAEKLRIYTEIMRESVPDSTVRGGSENE